MFTDYSFCEYSKHTFINNNQTTKIFKIMNIISKFSLYDIIAMVIPGFTILLFITSLMGYKWTVNEMNVDSTVFWIVAATLSYCLGIVNEVISRQLWAELRNNPYMINDQLKKIKNEIGTNYNLPTVRKNLEPPFCCCYMCKCILATLVFIGFTEMAIDKLISINDAQHASTLLIYFFLLLVAILVMLSLLTYYENNAQTNDAKELINKYYEFYYKVSSNEFHSGTSTIESQVAFLQNMSIPIFLFAVLPTSKYATTFDYFTDFPNDFWYYNIKGLLILLLVLILYTVYRRIEKIYYLIWSDYEYLKRIKEKSNNPCPFNRKA